MSILRKLNFLFWIGTFLGSSQVFAQSGIDLFRANFRAVGWAFDGSSNQVLRVKLTEKDIVAQCVGTNGTSINALMRRYTLAYNATADSLQVVTARDGSLVCDVVQFAGAEATQDDGFSTKFTFMFLPGGTNAFGSAVIVERGATNVQGTIRDRAGIRGQLQFALNNDTVLGGATDVLATAVLSAPIVANPVPGANPTSDTNTVITGGSTGTTTNNVISSPVPNTTITNGITAVAPPAPPGISTMGDLASGGGTVIGSGTGLSSGSTTIDSSGLLSGTGTGLALSPISAPSTTATTNPGSTTNATSTNLVVSVPGTNPVSLPEETNTISAGSSPGVSAGVATFFSTLASGGATGQVSGVRVFTGTFATGRRIIVTGTGSGL
jgi:hypothetical protein